MAEPIKHDFSRGAMIAMGLCDVVVYALGRSGRANTLEVYLASVLFGIIAGLVWQGIRMNAVGESEFNAEDVGNLVIMGFLIAFAVMVVMSPFLGLPPVSPAVRGLAEPPD